MKSRRSLVIVALFGILAIVASALAERRPWRGEVALPGVEQVASAETEAAEAPSRPAPAEALLFGEATQVQDSISASRRTAIVRAAERVAPAVVSVHVVRRQVIQPRTLLESFFAPFFLPPGAEREVSGLGSGFIIRSDGVILTNEHVVRGADEIVVTLADGREFEAELVGADEATDIALLRVRGARDLPAAPLGNSEGLLTGEWVVAIGNPFGYLLSNTEPTVTAGVVSAVARNIIPSEGEGRSRYYLDMIQTDAAINPGNSGGPLVNALGEVVGVNASIFSRSGGSEGLGFAIPINRATRIAADLLEHGRVRRAWVGIDVGPVEGAGAGRAREVAITDVKPGSPAASAGLRPGSVLLEVGGRPVRTPLDWEARLLDLQVGRPVTFVVAERGERRSYRITPRDLPSLTAKRVRALEDFELVTLTPAIRAERGLASEQGALIVSISAGARAIGLRAGDLIVEINGRPIRTAEEAAELLQRAAGRMAVRMTVERAGRYFSIYFDING